MVLQCLTIGDPHFKTKNKKETDLMVTKTLELIDQIKPDFVVILGDTLDTHEKIHVVPLTQAILWIEKIASRLPVYLLIGNHDRPNNSDFLSGYHPFQGLKGKKNITVVDTTIADEIQGHQFLFVPYVPNGRFTEALTYGCSSENIPSLTTIFAHQEFFGAKMGAIISTSGDKWPLTYPFVVSGHIHDYSIPQENIVYTGTPMQHAFGDSSHKTISLFTFPNVEKSQDKDESHDKEQETHQTMSKENVTDELDKDLSVFDLRYQNIENSDLFDERGEELKKKGICVTRQNEFVHGIMEYRIDMGLPKKKIYRIHPREILTWIPPENQLIKVAITGTQSEIKACLGLDMIKQWKRMGISIVYKIIDTHEGIDHHIQNDKIKSLPMYDQRKFVSKLQDVVQHDDGQKYWYNKLFSSIQ